MKRLGLLLVLAVVMLTGCLTTTASWSASLNGSTQDDSGFVRESVHIPSEIAPHLLSFAEYESFEHIADQERSRAEGELRDPDLSDIPENGWIVTTQRSNSIDAAAGDFSVAIVQDANGNVIARHDIDAGVPRVVDSGFIGVDVFPLPDGPIAFPIVVRITDAIQENYWEWEFTPTEQ